MFLLGLLGRLFFLVIVHLFNTCHQFIQKKGIFLQRARIGNHTFKEHSKYIPSYGNFNSNTGARAPCQSPSCPVLPLNSPFANSFSTNPPCFFSSLRFFHIYRSTLENKEQYGLKRWEIGEIASKIGREYFMIV